VRIQFDTDEPVSLWAPPYRNGKPVDRGARTNPSAKHTGSGYALGWVEFTEATEVDEIRIRAGGGDPYREWELARAAVALRWTGADIPDEARPRWVKELQAAEDARMRAEAQRRANEPVSGGDVAFMSGFNLFMFALGIAGVVVPIWSAWKWQGGWRIAALVPAGVVGFVVARIVFDTTIDPTSHNLWPFEIIIFGGGALAAIGMLRLARRLAAVRG
jgi:hypothetical protein